MSLPSLTSRLTVNTAQFQAAMAAARQSIGDFGRTAAAELGGVTKKLAGLATALPALTSAGAALGGLTAAFGAAGVAAGAFFAAVKPQAGALTENAAAAEKVAKAQEDAARKQALADKLKAQGSDLAEKAQKAATSARLSAADAELAYQRQTAGIPKATADAALSLAKLKDAHQSWSDELAGDTMPVFTKGLDLLRGLLPSLTPLVKAAAGAFSGLLDRLGAATQGPGFAAWIQDMAAAAGPAITNLGLTIGNVFRGIGGIMQAFSGRSDGVTSGLVRMTDAFADWATALKGSEGFERFLDRADEGTGMLANLGSALFNLLRAISPLLGATATMANAFAELINSTPTPVLTALAAIITTIVIGLRTYALVQGIVTTATRAWAVAQAAWNIVMAMNPIGLVIIAIVALVAAIVLAWQHCEQFREIVKATWNAIKVAFEASINAIMAALSWLGQLPGMIGGWFTAAKDWAVGALVSLVSWVAGLPGRLVSALASLGSSLLGAARSGFTRMKDGAVAVGNSLLTYVRELPGNFVRGLGNLGSLLYGAGQDLIRGMINGVRSMAGRVAEEAKSVARSAVNAVKNVLGIGSPSKVFRDEVGRWIPAGIAAGITGNAGSVTAAMREVVRVPDMSRAVVPSGAALAAVAAGAGSVSRTTNNTVNLYGSSATASAVSAELAWLAKVGG